MACDLSTDREYDCLIVGGGPAGLSAAQVLSRQHYRVLVLDASLSIIASKEAAWHLDHSLLQSCEHIRGGDAARYPEVRIEAAVISRVWQLNGGGIGASTSSGKRWHGRVLVLAAGVRTVFPDIPGYQECWASGICSNIFHCNCFDIDAASAGVLAIGAMGSTSRSVTVAGLTKRLASNVTIYTDSDENLSEQIEEILGTSPISIDSRPIAKLETGRIGMGMGVVIHFADGSSKMESILVHEPKTELDGPFALQLGLDLDDEGHIKVYEPTFATSLRGVYAVGACAVPVKSMAHAIATGALAAAAISVQLTADLCRK